MPEIIVSALTEPQEIVPLRIKTIDSIVHWIYRVHSGKALYPVLLNALSFCRANDLMAMIDFDGMEIIVRPKE